MDLRTGLDIIRNLLLEIPFNYLDYFLLTILLFYLWEEAELGLLAAFFNFSSVIIAFFLALTFYTRLSYLFIHNFNIVKGLSDAFAFVMLGFFAFFLLTLIANSLNGISKIYLPKTLNYLGGLFFGLASFLFFAAFFLSLFLSFPLLPLIKNGIKDSVFAQLILARTNKIEADIKDVFGGAVDNLLNFLTIEPKSDETLKLNFAISNPPIDKEEEQRMFVLLNIERANAGLPAFAWREDLTAVARLHSSDMLINGYFSHYSLSGLSPFDRLEKANISYAYAGENLAFAPDSGLAMSGLMKSPGHRANILNKNFRQIGIGVADGGIYGKMFSQEFTD